uniref:Putative methyltransferase n=1 Tax=viral metagenome TaxID=1070528 RepID=A0A6M3KQL9_9ZZZZ
MYRLNIGCGEYLLEGFENCDENPAMPASIHYHAPPIPREDGSVDEIWACHVLEHMDYHEGGEFLAECYRVLVSGGGIGVVVPDTREIMRRYLSGAPDCVEFPLGQWNPISNLDEVCALFLYSTRQESPHRWSYDRDTLARAMATAGFRGFKEIDRYRDPRLGSPVWYQCGIQGVKPGEGGVTQ